MVSRASRHCSCCSPCSSIGAMPAISDASSEARRDGLAPAHPKPGNKARSAESGARLSEGQRLSWLRLIRSENVGPATFRALVKQFGGAEADLTALPMLSRRGGRTQSIRVCTEVEALAELEAADRVGALSWQWESRAILRRSP